MNPQAQAQARVREGPEVEARPPASTEPEGGTRSTWRRLDLDVVEETIECFSYRRTLKTDAITEWIFFSPNGIIEPLYRKRSRSGAHGEDCYDSEDLEKAIITIRVEVSNSGKDYSEVWVRNNVKIPITLIRKILKEIRGRYEGNVARRLEYILSKTLLNHPDVEVTA